VPDGGLAGAIRTSDLVVACSGTVGRVLDAEMVARSWAATGRPLVIVDLALRNDVDPAVGTLPGVRLINLETIRRNAPEEQRAPVEQAHELVAAAVAEFEAADRARRLEVAVIAERRRVLGELEAEARRIREATDGAPRDRDGGVEADSLGPATGDAGRGAGSGPGSGAGHDAGHDAAHHERLVRSLRRRTRALLHPPTVRARVAARAGDDREYRAALAELAAIPAPPVPVRAASRRSDQPRRSDPSGVTGVAGVAAVADPAEPNAAAGSGGAGGAASVAREDAAARR
jgi:glutamyl-tRNA reductase